MKLAASQRRPGPKESKVDAAAAWLREFLEGGPKLASDVKTAAVNAGFSERTIERAKTEIQAESFREEFRGGYYWRKWQEPAQEETASRTHARECLQGFGDLGENTLSPLENSSSPTLQELGEQGAEPRPGEQGAEDPEKPKPKRKQRSKGGAK